MSTAAFFDLDGTLITANSAWLWMQSERKAGRLGLRHIARGLAYLAAYRIGVIDMDRALTDALQTVRDLPEETLRQRTWAWFEQDVAPRFASRVGEVLTRHREQGDKLVLLTSASVYESEAVTRHLGLDDFLCTRYQVVEGHLTGQPVRPICYGEGKVAWAQGYAHEHDIDLAQSTFYTDSVTDLPMMEAVGHPVAVHPDPRLSRVARRRGWPVERWDG